MKVTILGIARSGIAAALASNRLGYDIFLSDFGMPEKRFIDEIENSGYHTKRVNIRIRF